jgi:hypothetical protein
MGMLWGKHERHVVPGGPGYLENGSRVREVLHWQMPIALARCNAISIWMESEMAPMAWAFMLWGKHERHVVGNSMPGSSRSLLSEPVVAPLRTRILCKADPVRNHICELQLPMRRGMSPLKPSIWLIVEVSRYHHNYYRYPQINANKYPQGEGLGGGGAADTFIFL